MKSSRFFSLQSSSFALVAVLLVFASLFPLYAQTENRKWKLLGSPPPRITGIVSVGDTVLVSTENGAYSLTTTATAWTHQSSVPSGRFLQSTSGDVLSIGANIWLYSTSARVWRTSTNPAHTALGKILPQNVPLLTQATVRMPSGYDVSVTRGGVSVRQDSVWRQTLFSPFDGTRGIVGLVRLGVRMYVATERGVAVGEEITVAKASPFEPLAFKRFVWKSCDDGLVKIIENVQVLGGRMIMEDKWFSSDSGQTWNYRAQDSLRSIILVPTKDSALLAPTSGALLRSLDGGQTWVNAGFTMPRGMRWYQDFRTKRILPCIVGSNAALTLFLQDTTLRTLRPTHVLESQDGGLTWQRQEVQGLSDNVALGDIAQSPRGFLFAKDVAFQRSTLYRSQDGGKTWRTLLIGRVPETLVLHPTSGTLFLSGSPPMRSSDNGTTWTAAEGLPFRTSGRFEGASEFAFATNNVVLLNIRTVGAFRSSDGGLTFAPRNLTLPDVYILRGVLNSLPSGLPNGELLALSAVTSGNQTRSNLWASRNGGLSWERLENGFPTHDNFLLNDVIRVSNGDILALSSHGMFRLESPKTSIPKTSIKTALLTSEPEVWTLQAGVAAMLTSLPLRIAPNPAQNQVNITFMTSADVSAGSNGNVQCEIFTRNGQHLQTVVFDEAAIPAGGVQSLSLDVSGLSSGYYFCRMRCGNTSQIAMFSIVR